MKQSDALWFVVLALVLGLPMLSLFTTGIRKVRFLQREGVPAKGLVVKTRATQYGSYSVVEFTGPDGVTRKFNAKGSVSGEVDIVYDPDKPKHAVAVRNLAVTWRDWFGVVFFAAVFFGWLIAALVVALKY